MCFNSPEDNGASEKIKSLFERLLSLLTGIFYLPFEDLSFEVNYLLLICGVYLRLLAHRPFLKLKKKIQLKREIFQRNYLLAKGILVTQRSDFKLQRKKSSCMINYGHKAEKT